MKRVGGRGREDIEENGRKRNREKGKKGREEGGFNNEKRGTTNAGGVCTRTRTQPGESA